MLGACAAQMQGLPASVDLIPRMRTGSAATSIATSAARSWPSGENTIWLGVEKTPDPREPRTTLYWLVGDQLREIGQLPSGGDNSHPGFVAIDGTRALLSYYSSHEGSGSGLAPSAIYLSELTLS